MSTPHVFLTRFNVPTNRIESAIYSESWLQDRISLFETFTLPSVRAQSPADRSWVIYLGADSPSWLKDYMAFLETEGLLHPVYLSERRTEADIQADIQRATGHSTGRVITSNLDNDDGLAHDYVERIRRLDVTDQPAVLYLDAGLILHQDTAYLRVDRHNAFSAVAADLGSLEFRSCWSEWHNRLHLVLPPHHEQGDPAWLQVVHSVNVSNRVRGRRVDHRRYEHLFHGVLAGCAVPSRAEVRRDRLVLGPTRDVRDALRTHTARTARELLGTRRFDQVKYVAQRARHRGISITSHVASQRTRP